MAAYEEDKQEEEEEEEEFTFPSITNTPPRFFESPPLWRPSPLSSSSNAPFNGGKEGGGRDDDHEVVEEKMDVLWEDLNEDNFKNRGLLLKSGISGGGNVKFGCLQAFNPKGGKRPGVFVFIKVLGKWLLLRNGQRSIKKLTR